MDAKGFLSRRPHAVPALIAAVMLVGALGRWPYDYYKLLRWVTCAAAVFVAYQGYAWKQLWATWLFGSVTVLFNPFAPIHLTRQVWQPIDAGTALVFVLAVVILGRPATPAASQEEGATDASSTDAR